MNKPYQTLLSGVLIGGLLLPFGLAQGQVSPLFVENYPQSYVVQEGDTITRIASRFLVDPSSWDNMWLSTPYGPEDDELQAGDIVRVEFVNGRPRLSAQHGGRQVERITPEMREIGNTNEIAAIPLEDIQSSFTTNRIIAAEVFENAPYILSTAGKNIVIGTGDEIFARGTWPAGTRSFEIYRQVNTFRVREDSDAVDVELENVGTATIAGSQSDGIVRMNINSSNRDVKVGDRLLVREEDRFDPVIFPEPPSRSVDGAIIDMTNTERMASQLDSVLIDLGSRDGLASGQVLAIHQPGERIVDVPERDRMSAGKRLSSMVSSDKVDLPSREIGSILVYRVFDELSYGVILSSDEPARIGDRVINP